MEIIKVKDHNNERNGYVFYSIGNFLFDSHVKHSGVRNTFILKIEIDKNKKYDFSYLPCVIRPTLGYAPIPSTTKYQKIFPKKNTKYADNLYKYIECAKNASCNIETFNTKNIYYILLILIIIIIII